MYVRLVDELRRVFTLIFRDPDAAGVLAGLGDYDELIRLDSRRRSGHGPEQFIDSTYRAVLNILISWPFVVQAEVVPPVA
jgi:hypothetical protein